MNLAQNRFPALANSVLVPALVSLIVAGCAGKSTQPGAGGAGDGGYYGGDGPPLGAAVDPDSVPDAVPRREPPSATGNRPYTVFGKTYQPLASARGYVRRGTASWYGRKFQGRRTSSGEPYDPFAMTAAHPVLPLPCYARVTNLRNGKSVVVRVNDRGPFVNDRLIDLSYIAARKLGIVRSGTGRVEVRVIAPAADLPSTGLAGDGGVVDGGGTAAASPPAGETILIQVGAYSRRDNAHAMRQRLDRAGYRAGVTPPSRAQPRAFYRVRVGPFTSRDEARAARQNLESLLGRPVAVVIE